METIEGPVKALIVAALLPQDEALVQRLAKHWEGMNISIQRLSSWEDIVRLDREMTLVTSPTMLEKCPPDLQPRVKQRRNKLLVATHRQEVVHTLSQTARFLLPHASDIVLMGVDAPVIMPSFVESDRLPICDLNERELQVLRGMADGQSNGQIARSLHLEETTIKTYADRVFRKLDAKNRTQAAVKGVRLGIV